MKPITATGFVALLSVVISARPTREIASLLEYEPCFTPNKFVPADCKRNSPNCRYLALRLSCFGEGQKIRTWRFPLYVDVTHRVQRNAIQIIEVDTSVENPLECNRMRALHWIALSFLSVASFSTLVGTAAAACLPGDSSASCIGVYKVPVDDRILPYTSTPEQLKKFAPDLRWVPPVELPFTYDQAFVELSGPLRERCATLKEKVMKGKLEEAGVDLLGVAPRVTACVRVIIGKLEDAAEKQQGLSFIPEDYSMKAYRISVALSDLEYSFGQCDVLIGQGLRGELGVMAPAQLQILAEMSDMNKGFEELVKIIPAKI